MTVWIHDGSEAPGCALLMRAGYVSLPALWVVIGVRESMGTDDTIFLCDIWPN
jgi:hypothetical protein